MPGVKTGVKTGGRSCNVGTLDDDTLDDNTPMTAAAEEGCDKTRDASCSFSLETFIDCVIGDGIVVPEYAGLTLEPLKKGSGGKSGKVTEKGGGGDMEEMPPKKGSGGSVMFVLADDGATGVKAGKEKHTYSTS